eukprot:5383523-Pleurochrysis_carterae.AAC.7
MPRQCAKLLHAPTQIVLCTAQRKFALQSQPRASFRVLWNIKAHAAQHEVGAGRFELQARAMNLGMRSTMLGAPFTETVGKGVATGCHTESLPDS